MVRTCTLGEVEAGYPVQRPEPRFMTSESTPSSSKLKVDFAVADEETDLTVHAILELVHPDSIGIFTFDPERGSAPL